MEEPIKNYKSLIYVSVQENVIIEQMARERVYTLSGKFINEFNFIEFIQKAARNLNGVNFFILDINSFTRLTKDKDFIAQIRLIREMYPSLRLIILAMGYKQGNVLLGKLFNEGIYNIITASDDVKFREELEKCFSDEGMTYANSMKFRLDEESIIKINQTTNVVQEKFVKVKQFINIGVVGTEKHIGTTTTAINLAKFLNSIPSTSACYIEYNDHDTISNFQNLDDSIYYQDARKISYQGVDMFFMPKTIADIQKHEYEFYVYDFGSVDELTIDQKNNFMSRDVKIIVSGKKKWEEKNLIATLFTMGIDDNTYIIINFIDEAEREKIKEELGAEYRDRSYFLNLTYNPFEVKNEAIFNLIFKPFLFESVITEEKAKKFNFKNIFSRKEKKNK